ncbi:MAG TPA: hypothetical protein PKH07_10570, partial [bacterium]|nr:hypothetical protein [bacterium]
MDERTDDGGDVKITIDLFEHSSGSCGGRVTRNFNADTATCQVGNNDTDKGWYAAWSDGKADCAGGYSDPGDCHLPDIFVSYPGSPGNYAYTYEIDVDVCDFDGTNCTNDSESGCFIVEWYCPVKVGIENGSKASSIGTTWDPPASTLARACAVSPDPCTDDYRLMLGSGYGKYSSRIRNAEAVANFTANTCGLQQDVGEIPSDEDLIIYVDTSYAIDTTASDGGIVKVKIDVDEWNTTHGVEPCTGDKNRTFPSDTAECDVDGTASNRSWQTPWSDSKGDCSGGYGDPGDCHNPDIGISFPSGSGTGTYCYEYYIEISVCDSDGTNCTTDKET